jgi:hypothetical protein
VSELCFDIMSINAAIDALDVSITFRSDPFDTRITGRYVYTNTAVYGLAVPAWHSSVQIMPSRTAQKNRIVAVSVINII